MSLVRLRLYKTEDHLKINKQEVEAVLKSYDLSVHKLPLFQLSKFGYGFFINLFWYIFTFGSFKVLSLKDRDKLVHFTYIIPKVFRFPFMKKGDIQIGPCLTTANYRKKGIYGFVLQYIIAEYATEGRSLWIYTAEHNRASQSVIEKVGFQFYSDASISRLARIVKIIK
jgi:hypothetical protein